MLSLPPCANRRRSLLAPIQRPTNLRFGLLRAVLLQETHAREPSSDDGHEVINRREHRIEEKERLTIAFGIAVAPKPGSILCRLSRWIDVEFLGFLGA